MTISPPIDRRRLLSYLSGLGIGTVTWQRALANSVAETGTISEEMIRQAEWIAGIELTDATRRETAEGLSRRFRQIDALRQTPIGVNVVPALHFRVDPHGQDSPIQRNTAQVANHGSAQRPPSNEELAFLPVSELAQLVAARKVTSTELTNLYLNRLRKYDPILKCVVTLTEDLAREQAARADREIAAGKLRGPLHGIPWGAKDLIAVPRYPTTWGATPLKTQVFNELATVARRLEEAGAVLVAKLSLGALAQGDKWFGKMTRNPWDPRQGSSGSSAGSASAVAAGLVGFALGSETLGSIISPCRRCGATGLRPTFGRVSRQGCMALAWSMDKIGPIARSVEDCALVLDAIHGTDGHDATVADRAFHWPPPTKLRELRVGYTATKEGEAPRRELEILRQLGVELVEMRLPDTLPTRAMASMLDVEAATMFDHLSRQGVTEDLNKWPQTFREAGFISAVEYLRASRLRSLLVDQMNQLFERIDLYVGGRDLVITNLTGHPSLVLPNGFRERDGRQVPTAITFTGRPFQEEDLMAVAHQYQIITKHHQRRPDLDSVL